MRARRLGLAAGTARRVLEECNTMTAGHTHYTVSKDHYSLVKVQQQGQVTVRVEFWCRGVNRFCSW